MRTMNTKIFTLLIVGMVALTATTTVFSAVDYNSSRSNTTEIADKIIRDLFWRYGISDAEIDKVTGSLAVGISKIDLKATLIEVGISKKGIQEVFIELDRLGVGDTTQSTTGISKILTPEYEVSAPDAEDISPSAAETRAVEEILSSKQAESASSDRNKKK